MYYRKLTQNAREERENKKEHNNNILIINDQNILLTHIEEEKNYLIVPQLLLVPVYNLYTATIYRRKAITALSRNESSAVWQTHRIDDPNDGPPVPCTASCCCGAISRSGGKLERRTKNVGA